MTEKIDLHNIFTQLNAINNKHIRILIRKKMIIYIKKEKNLNEKNTSKLAAILKIIQHSSLNPSTVYNICKIIIEKHHAWKSNKIKSFFLFLKAVEKAISGIALLVLVDEVEEAGEAEELKETEGPEDDEGEELEEEKEDEDEEPEKNEEEEKDAEVEEAEGFEVEEAEEEQEKEELEKEEQEEKEREKEEQEEEEYEEEAQEEEQEEEEHNVHGIHEVHEREKHEEHVTHIEYDKHDKTIHKEEVEHQTKEGHSFLPLDNLEKKKFFTVKKDHPDSEEDENRKKPQP